jgi:hypothetical protein
VLALVAPKYIVETDDGRMTADELVATVAVQGLPGANPPKMQTETETAWRAFIACKGFALCNRLPQVIDVRHLDDMDRRGAKW